MTAGTRTTDQAFEARSEGGGDVGEKEGREGMEGIGLDGK